MKVKVLRTNGETAKDSIQNAVEKVLGYRKRVP